MLLILCPLDDLDTLALARRWTREGIDCRIVTAEALSFARRRSHRVSGPCRSGAAVVRTDIDLTDRCSVSGDEFTGVLNRLVEPPAAAWRWAAAAERDYAVAELHAFTLSWLAGLPGPVRNRPVPGCLAGPAPHPVAVLAVAAALGLDHVPLRLSSRSTQPTTNPLETATRMAGPDSRAVEVICLDGVVLTPGVPARIADRLPALAADIGAAEALIGIHFAVGRSRWVFAGVTPLPALAAAGSAVYGALAAVLGARAAEVA